MKGSGCIDQRQDLGVVNETDSRRRVRYASYNDGDQVGCGNTRQAEVGVGNAGSHCSVLGQRIQAVLFTPEVEKRPQLWKHLVSMGEVGKETRAFRHESFQARLQQSLINQRLNVG